MIIGSKSLGTLDYIRNKYGLVDDRRVELAGGRDELSRLWHELGFTVGAEIGVERGMYSKVICNNSTNVKLYCIDAWTAYKGYRDHVSQHKLDDMYEDTIKRLESHNVEVIKGYSLDVVKQFKDNSLDFVYIDANHDFQNVCNDVIEWSKKVRPGGMVCGHDYRRTKGGAVNDTVDVINAYVNAKGIKPLLIWRGDRASSWSWVKV